MNAAQRTASPKLAPPATANGARATAAQYAGPGGEQKADETTKPTPESPALHGSHEIKLDFGEGSITGGITATLEFGQTGVALGAKEIKALESTASVQLNGLVTKLETALLTGELEGDVFEGLKIAIEANAITAGIDSEGSAEVDLMTITVKLVGDAGHLLNAGPNVTLTVDGRLSISLGGKLAAKLASFTVAQLEQQMLVKEMSDVGETVAKHADEIKDLEATADLLDSQGKHKLADEARDKAFKARLQVSTGKQQLEGLSGKLKAAKGKADKAISKLKGKVAKQVAKAMEKKAVKFIATKLMKLVPVLNIISTIVDVIELAGILKNLISGDFGGEGGDGESKKDKGEGAGGSRGKGEENVEGAGGPEAKKPADGKAGEGSPTGTSEPADPEKTKAIEAAKKEATPAARAILDALTTTKSTGPHLTPDEIKMVGMLVPADLSAEELTEVLATLRAKHGKAATAEEVIEAIDTAVRAVRNRGRTVKVNGEDRPDLARGDATEETTSSQAGGGGEGPVTSPDQVEGPSRPIEIVRGGDPAVLGRWFRADGANLVWTTEGTAWKQEHRDVALDAKSRLVDVAFSAERADRGWRLAVTFVYSVGRETRRKTHRFFVTPGGEDDGFGAKVGDLKFEGYQMVDSPP